MPIYKSYTALFTQAGSNDPSVTPLEKTVGDITWTRVDDSDGIHFVGISTGAFPQDKTIFPPFDTGSSGSFTMLPMSNALMFDYGWQLIRINDDTVWLIVFDSSYTAVDLSAAIAGTSTNLLIQIQVYP